MRSAEDLGAPPEPRIIKRNLVVKVLIGEILGAHDDGPFRLQSEFDLMKRFGLSRVTIRWALNDLENMGLIYRKHGKGTFAHGRKVYREWKRQEIIASNAPAMRTLLELAAGGHSIQEDAGKLLNEIKERIDSI